MFQVVLETFGQGGVLEIKHAQCKLWSYGLLARDRNWNGAVATCADEIGMVMYSPIPLVKPGSMRSVHEWMTVACS